MIIRFFREKYLYVAAAILVILNIILLQFPLLGALGYESSLVNSVFIVIFSGISVMGKLKRGAFYPGSFAKAFISLLEEFALFMLLPLAVFVFEALFFKSCPLGLGLQFYFLFIIPALIIGGGLGALSRLIFKRYPGAVFPLLFICVLLPSAIEMYSYPQTYFYNAIIPYFPGSFYDEAIEITPALISSRILYAVYFGLLLTAALTSVYLKWKRIYKLVISAVSMFIFILIVYNSPNLGLATTVDIMAKELDGKAETAHFTIYFPSSIDKKELESIILHHEYYYSELVEYFKTKPSKKITSFLFLNTEQKQRLLGPANADVAKPWLYQTYTNYDNYKSTLKHEIAHCFSAEFGITMFKGPYGFNPSLAEGIAMAAENEYGESTIHYMAALAYINNYKYPLDKLFTGLNFFAHNSAFSYIYAGSFVKYLADKYGIEKFKELYGSADYEKIYGKDITALAGDYYKFIAQFSGDSSKAKSIYYFGRASIFNKECPRYSAARLTATWKLYAEEKYSLAEKEFEKLYDDTRTYSALAGRVGSLIKLQKYEAAWKYLESVIAIFDSTPYAFNLNLQLADLRAINGDYIEAGAIYSNLRDNSPTNTFYYISDLRLNLIRDAARLSAYLKSSDYEKLKILKALNNNGYVYSSIPPMIDLSSSLKEDYNAFIRLFDREIIVNDFISAYAAYRLSERALENLDYDRAEKFALAAAKFTTQPSFSEILQSNLAKVQWLKKYSNHSLKSLILNF
jgi:hypothetical protein